MWGEAMDAAAMRNIRMDPGTPSSWCSAVPLADHGVLGGSAEAVGACGATLRVGRMAATAGRVRAKKRRTAVRFAAGTPSLRPASSLG